MNINKADLNELEFTELLSEIIPFVYSQKTADRLANLRPMPFDEAKKALKKTSEFLSSFESANAIPFNEYEDIEQELKLMMIEDFRLENKSFIRIKNITEQVGRLQKFFPTLADTFPTLNEEVRDLVYRKEIVEKIDKVLNRFGEVKSEASANLRVLREEIGMARKSIDENFNKTLNFYAQNDFLDDIRETIMDGQRVLAVKSVFKKRVSGRVLGTSKTGSITYIQPDSVIKHYFKLRETQDEENKEINSRTKRI